MQRRTATLLLLAALVGTFLPLATAITAAPAHACCIRAAHKCHLASTLSGELGIRGASCCHHECCRAVRISQRALLLAPSLPLSTHQFDQCVVATHLSDPALRFPTIHSPRAPPHVSLA